MNTDHHGCDTPRHRANSANKLRRERFVIITSLLGPVAFSAALAHGIAQERKSRSPATHELILLPEPACSVAIKNDDTIRKIIASAEDIDAASGMEEIKLLNGGIILDWVTRGDTVAIGDPMCTAIENNPEATVTVHRMNVN